MADIDKISHKRGLIAPRCYELPFKYPQEENLRVLVIPDVHLKHWMFDSAAKIMKSEGVRQAVCLMDIPDEWNQG